MSFGGFGGGGSQELAYWIKAYDMATPIFREFRTEVKATTDSIRVSLEELNKSMLSNTKTTITSVKEQEAALARLKAAYKSETVSAAELARMQAEYSRMVSGSMNQEALAAERAASKEVAANDMKAASAKRAADAQVIAARKSGAAFGASGSELSKWGGRLVLGAGAGAAAFVDLGAKFQANTLRMQTQAGVTTKQLDELRNGLLKMAGQVGSTPSQLANGMYHVVSSLNAVLPPSKRVSTELTIMKTAAEGAQIGHSNLEETTYALASAMNALHMGAKDAGKVMGELNAIVGSGDMTMTDLIDSFKSGLIPAANSFHISLQSVGAALAVMGDMGMRGSLAGTRLRMAISLIGAPSQQAAKILEGLGMSSTTAIASTERMSYIMAKAGVSITTLSSDLRKPDGLQVALVDLNHHLRNSGMTADGAAAAISRAFGGGRMGAAIQLMSENTGRLGSKFEYIGQKSNQFGADWQKTQATFRVQLDKAVAALEAFGTKMGQDLLPAATSVLHVLEDTANFFGKNKTALDLLGGAVITFSTVAIGSYFVSKMKGALGLMQDFGKGAVGMGKWLFGGGTPGAPAVTGSATSGAIGSATSSSMPGLTGYMGNPLRVGSMNNPLAVTMSGTGLSGGAVNQTEANLQKQSGVGPAVLSAAAHDTPKTQYVGMAPAEISALKQAEAQAAAQAAANSAVTKELMVQQAKMDVAFASGSSVEAAKAQAVFSKMAADDAIAGKEGAIAAAKIEAAMQSSAGVFEKTLLDSDQQLNIFMTSVDEATTTVTRNLGGMATQVEVSAATFQTAIDDMSLAAVRAGEQLSLGGIGTGVVSKVPTGTVMAYPPGSKYTGNVLTSQGVPITAAARGQSAAASGAAAFGTAPLAMSAEEKAAIIAANVQMRDAMAGSMMTSIKDMGSKLMKGGLIAGMGVMGAQMAGSMIGGKTGGAVSNIGTTAAIGAGLGSFFGPEGTFAGAVLGGLGGAFMTFIHKDASDYGKQIADKVTAPLGKDISKQFDKSITTSANTAKDALQQAQRDTYTAQHPSPVGGRFSSPTASAQSQAAGFDSLAAKEAAVAQKAFDKTGREAGLAFTKAFNHVQIKTEPQFIVDAKLILSQLPAQARPAAAGFIASYAETLIKNKKLPANAYDQIIKELESRYGNLKAFLISQGKENSDAIAKTMSWTGATKNLVDAEKDIRAKWGLFATDPNLNGHNAIQNIDSELAQLSVLSHKHVGKALHDSIIADMKILRTDTATVMSNILGDFETKLPQVTKAIKDNTHGAVLAAAQNFANMSDAIVAAMSAGVTTTGKGGKLIRDALHDSLQAMGDKHQLPQVGLISVAGLQSATGSILGKIAGGATGLRVPGSVSGDTYTVLDPTGQPIARVGGAELITNRHTENRVNQKLGLGAAYGLWGPTSLGAEVAGETTPHSYATGGRLPNKGASGVQLGTGYVFPFPQGTPFSWQRIDQGQDLQAPPGTRVLAIGPGNITQGHDSFGGFGPFFPIEQMSAGPFAGQSVYYGHTKMTHPAGKVNSGDVISVTQDRANQWTAANAGWLEIGFTTAFGQGIHGQGAQIAPELHALASGGSFAVGKGGTSVAALKWKAIRDLQVSGFGAVHDMVQNALNKEVLAANAYGQKRTSALNASNINTNTSGVGQAVSSGMIDQQVYNFFKPKGFNKIAIAGMLGNALQESTMNPNAPGGGLWQQISNFGSGTGGSLQHQMQVMLPQILGLRGSLNSAGSPGNAASIFMNQFERPKPATENLARRIQGANAAYAAGYNKGGRLPGYLTGGLLKGYDDVDPSLIPKNAQWAASYVDNSGGYAKAKNLFPNIPVVSISVVPGNNASAMVYDIEAPDSSGVRHGKSIAETIAAIKAGRTKGAYAGATDLAAVKAGLGGASFQEWVAAWPGTGGYTGASVGPYGAHQYAGDVHQGIGGGTVDLDVATPAFLQALTGSAGSGITAAGTKAKTGGTSGTIKAIGTDPWGHEYAMGGRMAPPPTFGPLGYNPPHHKQPTLQTVGDFESKRLQSWNRLVGKNAIPPGARYPHDVIEKTNKFGGDRPFTDDSRLIHFPWSFLPSTLNWNDPYYSWANEGLVHETAHTMQSNEVFNGPTWKVEGGAQAWSDKHSGFAFPGGDANYSGYVNDVKNKLGWDWINHKQFHNKLGGRVHKRELGGSIGYAGKFGDGGMFTAHGPTVGIFGEKGPENVYAVPHASISAAQTQAQADAATRTRTTTKTTPAGSTTTGSTSTSSIHGGTKTTTTTTTGSDHGFPTSTTTITTSPVKGSKAKGPAALRIGFNPLTDRIETHTSKEWQLIHARLTKANHDAAAQKRIYDAYLAGQVTDMLGLDGFRLGDLVATRKTDLANKLPLGGHINLASKQINSMSSAGFAAVESAVKKSLNLDTLGQVLHASKILGDSLSKGPDKPLFAQQSKLSESIKDLKSVAEAQTDKIQKLHAEALSAHSKQRKESLDKQITAIKEAGKDTAASINNERHKLGVVQSRIATSRPAQLVNISIDAALSAITKKFNAQQAQFAAGLNTIQLLANVPAGLLAKNKHGGIDLTKSGLDPLALKSLGITAAGAKSLIGTGTGSEAYVAQIKQIKDQQIPKDIADQKQLEAEYALALKTHNKKRQEALLKQLAVVTDATIKAYADLQAAETASVEAIYSKAVADTQKKQGALDIGSAIRDMSPGTDLSSIGLDPETLKKMGVTASAASEGTSVSALTTKMSASGVPISAADLAAASAGVTSTNQGLSGMRSDDITALKELIAKEPTLTGAAKDAADAHIKDLSATILSLTTTIDANTKSVYALQVATEQATYAQGQAQAASLQSGTDILDQIRNLGSGTDLSALGITPDMLASVGLNASTAMGLEGSGSAAISKEQQAQGGVLTPAQIAAAQAGTLATNATLLAQQKKDQETLAAVEASLPNLTGGDVKNAQTQIADLIKSILGLSGQMQDNTTATAALTAATNANTSATGQMTGTVSYAYQGQQYLAGAGLSSEQTANYGVGS